MTVSVVTELEESMVAQREPAPLKESSPFHQLRVAAGDDSPLVRVLMEMDSRLNGKIDRMDSRLNGLDGKLDQILEKLNA